MGSGAILPRAYGPSPTTAPTICHLVPPEDAGRGGGLSTDGPFPDILVSWQRDALGLMHSVVYKSPLNYNREVGMGKPSGICA